MALTVVAGTLGAAADDEGFAGAWIDSRGSIHIDPRDPTPGIGLECERRDKCPIYLS